MVILWIQRRTKPDRIADPMLIHLCSHWFFEIGESPCLPWLAAWSKWAKNFCRRLNLFSILLTKGKAGPVNWTFLVNEAFRFENRRWANRGLPYFHCLFLLDVVMAALAPTKILFYCNSLGRFIETTVNQAVLKRDGRANWK